MRLEVEEGLEKLKEMLKENKMANHKANNFIDRSEYEDDYSNNEIEAIQAEFEREARKYLEENYKGQYAIFSDWCVHIVTKEFYENNIKPYYHRDCMC